MIDTEYRSQEVLRWFRSDAMETLAGLEFYLKTLKKFVADSITRVALGQTYVTPGAEEALLLAGQRGSNSYAVTCRMTRENYPPRTR